MSSRRMAEISKAFGPAPVRDGTINQSPRFVPSLAQEVYQLFIWRDISSFEKACLEDQGDPAASPQGSQPFESRRTLNKGESGPLNTTTAKPVYSEFRNVMSACFSVGLSSRK